MKWNVFTEGQLGIGRAWTAGDVRRQVDDVLTTFAPRLPDPDAAVLIKPNLNNDLPSLAGNSTDLRVLAALLGALADRGHRQLTVADGSNVGMERRRIDAFTRLRVDRLARRHGARCLDLNRSEGIPTPLATGETQVAREVVEAPFLISVPKLKTHVVAGLSLSIKNWMGCVVAQRKRDVHKDLPLNLHHLARAVQPHLIVLDALVGMEGAGPGDGIPFRMDTLLAGQNMYLVDLAAARLVGYPWEQLGYLVHAQRDGCFPRELPQQIVDAIPVERPILRAPPRSPLAGLSEHKLLWPLKQAVRPVVDHPVVSRTAHRLGVIQDRYRCDDDQLTGFSRDESRCQSCGRCAQVCPDAIPREDIGTTERGQGCLGCLYCYWVCPCGGIKLQGDAGYLEAHIDRYKRAVERL